MSRNTLKDPGFSNKSRLTGDESTTGWTSKRVGIILMALVVALSGCGKESQIDGLLGVDTGSITDTDGRSLGQGEESNELLGQIELEEALIEFFMVNAELTGHDMVGVGAPEESNSVHRCHASYGFMNEMQSGLIWS